MQLDFALIRQKDHILGLVRDGKYEEALTLLNFSADLWAACSYAYKTAEIREIIRSEVRQHMNGCCHWKQLKKWGDLLAEIVS